VEVTLGCRRVCINKVLQQRNHCGNAPELRASKILQERAANNPKVKILTHTAVESIEGEDLVEKVVLKDTQTGERTELQVQGVFVFAGMKPTRSFSRVWWTWMKRAT